MDVGSDGMVFPHRDVEIKSEILDIRSSPFVMLIGIVFGAVKVSVQN